ncbi:MAG: hypothetical protein LBQ37_02565 [Elusimicrobiota bacterium]|jgi:hypothetical protein|nr:hypothetical protein [Elusimicrobiota bacterium]
MIIQKSSIERKNQKSFEVELKAELKKQGFMPLVIMNKRRRYATMSVFTKKEFEKWLKGNYLKIADNEDFAWGYDTAKYFIFDCDINYVPGFEGYKTAKRLFDQLLYLVGRAGEIK